MTDALKEFAAVSDGHFLRTMAAGSREQITEMAETYNDVLMMQAMASRLDAIAARLDAMDSAASPTEKPAVADAVSPETTPTETEPK